jgi:uncharacterized protein YacL
MAWDSKRPVPWKKLLRLIGLFLVLFNVFLYLSARDNYNIGTFGVSLFSALLYMLFAVVLAKFGMDPITQRERRIEAMAAKRAEKAAEKAAGPAGTSKGKKTVTTDRPRPPATSRTNAGNRQAPPKR